MVNRVRICPACGAWRTDGVETCSECGSENVVVDYSAIYWEKMDSAKREGIINEVIRSASPAFSLSELEKALPESSRLRVGNVALFNDDDRTFLISRLPNVAHNRDDFERFSYDNVVSFNTVEDGLTVTSGGTAGALVGGVLFGATGAIVGATTRKRKNVCSSLEVNIVLRNCDTPNFTSVLISPPGVEKTSELYRSRIANARELTSKLELITSSSAENVPNDPVNEIRRYKKLLDEGALSEDEFAAIKHKILGI